MSMVFTKFENKTHFQNGKNHNTYATVSADYILGRTDNPKTNR
jgi:hypothetical protein